MSRKLLWPAVAVSSLAMLGVSLPAAADDEKSEQKRSGIHQSGTAATSGQSGQFSSARASKLKGMAVKNAEDEKLGDVKDVLINLQEGRVGAVLIGSGGVLGVGEKIHPVPPGSLTYAAGEKEVILNVDKQSFKSSPTWDTSRKDYHSNLPEVYRHYNQQPSWQTEPGRQPTREPERDLGAVERGARETGRAVERAGRETGAAVERAGREAGSAMERAGRGTSGQANWIESSKLIGMNVRNASNQHMGEIQDIVLDLKNGRVVFCVLDGGGTVRDEFFAVPSRQFSFSTTDNALMLNATKEQIEQSPELSRNDLSKLDDPAWASQVYGYYGENVYWTESGRQPAREFEKDSEKHQKHEKQQKQKEY